jgi:hypothetical protein
MSIRDLLFKAVMNRVPRVRGFTKKCYFAHPFLDAFFVWFPLGNLKYGGAEVGEIYKVASRIIERDPMVGAKSGRLKAPGSRLWLRSCLSRGIRSVHAQRS